MCRRRTDVQEVLSAVAFSGIRTCQTSTEVGSLHHALPWSSIPLTTSAEEDRFNLSAVWVNQARAFPHKKGRYEPVLSGLCSEWATVGEGRVVGREQLHRFTICRGSF